MEGAVLRTPLCELLGIRHPVLQAGMGGRQGHYTPPELVAEVSRAGGLGVIGGAGLPPEELRRRIRRVRELTDRPFGVDLLLPVRTERPGGRDMPLTHTSVMDYIRRRYPQHLEFVERLRRDLGLPPVLESLEEALSLPSVRQQVQVVLEERVPVFVAGLGDPSWVVPLAREVGTRVLGIAGSVRHALRHKEAGVDLVVAQGTEGGGHTGRVATLVLVPQVVDAVAPLPVVAAGGIADGRGLAAALALGAVGAWCGTVFLAAEESALPRPMQEAVLSGTSEDFVVSRAYTGKTARQLRNPITEAWERSGLEPLPMPLQGFLMAELELSAERAGRYDLLFNPAGQAAPLAGGRRRPARRIVEEMVQGARAVLERLRGLVP